MTNQDGNVAAGLQMLLALAALAPTFVAANKIFKKTTAPDVLEKLKCNKFQLSKPKESLLDKEQERFIPSVPFLLV